MPPKFVQYRSRHELLTFLDVLAGVHAHGFSEKQLDEMLIEFCLNCPDPVGAMGAVIDAPQSSTSDEVLTAVLAMPSRSPSSYSDSELVKDHPLRTWRLKPQAV
ncbi:hypothetical protein [Acidovorax sp. K2F]|uniref:hypothetical protein n=1 Tax=Acidovorax sp. K2F TaxID=2978125 RepID=UPI0021B0CB7F|nr:hypothetical protein [Acidovorax sp. K2F]MCT6721615.1 hypothetical protein [Acidovorax sp. K2F]